MSAFLFEAHIHTSLSLDAWQSPESVVRSAVSKGISAIAITDHNSFHGIGKAQQESRDKPVLVVPGEEVATDYGDVIGLFLNGAIKSRILSEVIDEIHDQGGVIVLPHPMRRKIMPSSEDLARIDLFETLNSRTSCQKNCDAVNLVIRLGKNQIGGSDAHFPWEIGNVLNIFPEPVSDLEELRMRVNRGAFSISGNPQPGPERIINMGMSYSLKKWHTLVSRKI